MVSRDRPRADAPLVDDYRWRVHSECHCRDAHQYWGLEDFMHVTPTGGPKAANRSWCMVQVASRLQAEVRPRAPDDSLRDLNADGRGYPSVAQTSTRRPEKPAPV